LTRSGDATPLFYLAKGGKAEVPLGGQWKNQPGFVRVDGMIAAFEKAVRLFRQFINQQDATRKDQILSRCGEWFDTVSPNSGTIT
jgi:hypothetical protein